MWTIGPFYSPFTSAALRCHRCMRQVEQAVVLFYNPSLGPVALNGPVKNNVFRKRILFLLY